MKLRIPLETYFNPHRLGVYNVQWSPDLWFSQFSLVSYDTPGHLIILLHTWITRKFCADFKLTVIYRQIETESPLLWLFQFDFLMQHQLFFRFNTPFLKQAARQKEISQEKCRRRILLATFEWIFKISFLKGRGVVCHMLRDSNHMISSAIWNK